MVDDKNSIDMEKTFKQGVGGGILGMFVGAPGLGMGLGMMHANKEKLKNWGQNINSQTRINPEQKKQDSKQQRPRAVNDPAYFFR